MTNAQISRIVTRWSHVIDLPGVSCKSSATSKGGSSDLRMSLTSFRFNIVRLARSLASTLTAASTDDSKLTVANAGIVSNKS